MGWQDVLAKHHPIPAFFAAVISNIITGNKAGENENTNDTNHYNESASSDHDYTYGSSAHQPAQYYYPPTQTPSSSLNKLPKNKSSSSDHDYTYGPSEIQPAHYYYPPTPIPSSSSHNTLPKKTKNNTYNQGQQIDYYNNGVNNGHYNNSGNNGYYNNGGNNEQIAKPKGWFWKRKDEHIVDKAKGYGEKGKVTRSYMDWNGQEVVEERDYEIQTYYELQMSPAKVVETRKNKSNYQGARRTRYN